MCWRNDDEDLHDIKSYCSDNGDDSAVAARCAGVSDWDATGCRTGNATLTITASISSLRHGVANRIVPQQRVASDDGRRNQGYDVLLVDDVLTPGSTPFPAGA